MKLLQFGIHDWYFFHYLYLLKKGVLEQLKNKITTFPLNNKKFFLCNAVKWIRRKGRPIHWLSSQKRSFDVTSVSVKRSQVKIENCAFLRFFSLHKNRFWHTTSWLMEVYWGCVRIYLSSGFWRWLFNMLLYSIF